MSADLDRMFSALRADVDAARLDPPVALRRQGDRRTRRYTLAGLVAVALLVAGVSVGGRIVFAGSAAPPAPGGTATPSLVATPSPVATPSRPPAPSPSSIPDPADVPEVHQPITVPLPPGCGDDGTDFPQWWPAHAGQPLPASMMLRARDWGPCYAMSVDRPGYPVRNAAEFHGSAPDVCRDYAPYAADANRVAGRYRKFVSGPEVSGFESVTRYRPGAAEAFLAEVRSRVVRCATFHPAEMPSANWHAKIVDRGFAGDESLLIYVGTGTDGKGYPGWYIGVVRVGDVVAVVEPAVDLGGQRSYALTMTRKAADHLPR